MKTAESKDSVADTVINGDADATVQPTKTASTEPAKAPPVTAQAEPAPAPSPASGKPTNWTYIHGIFQD